MLPDYRTQEKRKCHVRLSSWTTVWACYWADSGVCVGRRAWLEMDSRVSRFVGLKKKKKKKRGHDVHFFHG